jgi:hypothetical protein
MHVAFTTRKRNVKPFHAGRIKPGQLPPPAAKVHVVKRKLRRARLLQLVSSLHVATAAAAAAGE